MWAINVITGNKIIQDDQPNSFAVHPLKWLPKTAKKKITKKERIITKAKGKFRKETIIKFIKIKNS